MTDIIPGGFNADSAVALLEQRHNALVRVRQSVLKEGLDYGVIPGVQKPTLLKPGAEKLCALFGLSPQFEILDRREDWDSPEPFFYYLYRCRLYRDGIVWGEGDGSANSRESKHRYRWVPEALLPAGIDKSRLLTRGGSRTLTEFRFALDKRETGGKYGKPESYWALFDQALAAGTARVVQRPIKSGELREAVEITVDETLYRVGNPDICDLVNTLAKIAQKRAFVAAVLIATGASETFTQDVEDLEIIEHVPQPAVAPVETQPRPVVKPWNTVSEMILCFAELRDALGQEVYQGVLQRFGASSAKDFINMERGPQLALECWSELRREVHQ